MATRTALTDRQWAIASRIIPFISPHKVIPRTKAERERSLNLCKETLNNILETHQNDNSALIEDLRALKTSIMGQTEDLRKYTKIWNTFFKNAKAIGLANPHALFEPMQIDIVAKLYEEYQSLIAIWERISKQIPNAPVLKTGLEIRTWMNDPQNAGALGTITNLDLSKLNLRVIPQEIEKLSNLTKLDLSNNQISVIPDAIARLTNVRMLNLSNNLISVIPDAIASLTNLTELYLLGNRISVIPDAIARLSNLKGVYLSGNRISVIPDAIASLTNLTELYLLGNRISVIPDAIPRLSNLTELYLSGNRISVIPDAIPRLSNLTELYLSGNRISVIPDAIARLTNLRALNLSYNRISVIPDAIAGLTNLTTLHLSYNRISVIPDAIARLTNLRALNLTNNQISVIPDAIPRLSNLTTLYLSYNRISVIPDAIARLSNLTTLYLSYNQISVIPDAIARLSNLTTLYLSYNRISVIPDAIARLSNLRALDLSANLICVIERNVLSSANNSISANPLMIRFKKELSHPARYPLAILFHAIMSEKSFEEQQKLFASLSLQDQNLVFEMVYFTAKELGLDPDKDNDPIWGEHRVFDSSDIFVRAVRSTILHKFMILLPQDQKNRVYGKVYDLASDRDPSDSRWGENHALENLPRLADAMAEC